MANWIKAIYFVVILAWVIYVLSDDVVKYKSFPGFAQDRISPRRQGGALLRLPHGTG